MAPRRIATTFSTMLARGLTRRCPRCGSRGWFRHWFHRADRCPGCGVRIERQDGFMLGAVTINTITTFGLLLVVIVVGFAASYPDVAVWPMLVAGVAVALVWPIVFWPFSHTIWAAIDFAMRPVEAADVVDPGVAAHAARQAG